MKLSKKKLKMISAIVEREILTALEDLEPAMIDRPPEEWDGYQKKLYDVVNGIEYKIMDKIKDLN